MKERRKHPRRRINFPLYCNCLKSGTSFYSVFENISIGGMRLNTNELLTMNELMKFEMDLLGSTVSGEGKIVWCKSLSFSKGHEVGIEFTNMESKSREILAEFLHDAEFI